MNHDERRGRDANLAGRPFNNAENIDWQLGWQNAQADRCLDDDDDYPEPFGNETKGSPP